MGLDLIPERVGLSPVNRAGIGVEIDGTSVLCYAGRAKNLDLLSGAPGLEWRREWGCLALPITRENVLLLETVGGVEEAPDEYVHVRNTFLSICTKSAEKYPHLVEGTPPPFQHQRDAFAFAQEVFDNGGKGFAQLSSMGTGKSRWAIDLMRERVSESALIVVQNSTSLQWKANLETLWPEARVTILTGTSIYRRKRELALIKARLGEAPEVVVVNWEALGKLQEPLFKMGFDFMVADEATRCKDRNTVMSKAAYQIGKTCLWRCAMTGTPFGNSPEDIWAIYRFLDDKVFGTRYWDFAERFFKLGGFTGKQFVGFIPERLPEFINKMYSCAYRITKSCITDMPEKCYETIKLTMEGEQRLLYEKVAKDLYASRVGEDGEMQTLTVANALVAVTRLQQITAGLFPSNEGEPRCEAIPSVKTQWVVDYVREALLETDAQLSIWCRFTKEIERVGNELAKLGIPFGVIAGNVKGDERESLRVAFNDRDNPFRVLIIQLQAGAFGLDLPGIDTSIFHSSSYSYLERSQSEDRGHRMGRVRPYSIIDVVCKNSVDIEILAALKEKASLADILLAKGFLGIPVKG